MKKILVLDAFTNGHEAALKLIRAQGWKRRECDIVFCGSHSALLKRLTEGPAYAVVPVYNTIAGNVSEVLNQLAHYRGLGYDFRTIRRLKLRIDHCLMAPQHVQRPKDLDRVMSHEKAIQQCGKFLDSIGLAADKRSKRDSTGNAAKAVSRLSPSVNIGAIAPKCAARAYGLRILAERIQDVQENFTTFELVENQAAVARVTVGIIGIAGRFGSLLRSFFEGLGCDVIGSDPKLPDGLTNEQVVRDASVIIFAVQIMETPKAIKKILRLTRPDQLLMDVTSVKGPAVKMMLRSKAQVVGLHPMFAPEAGFDGQTIVVCPARLETSSWKTWVMNMLAATGAKLKWSTPEEHDMYMATVQASPHLANLVNAALIMEMGVSTKESLTFTSPFYRVMFSLMGRFLSQDPDLYSAIIMKNPATVAMVRKRIEIERRLLKMIQGYDRGSFRALFEKAREHFGSEVTQEANELFLRIIAVMKTLYGKNSLILEFSKADNKPGLLERILKAFRRRGVNLAGINFVSLGDKRMQFTLSLEQPTTSDSVRRALEEIELWDSPKIRAIG